MNRANRSSEADINERPPWLNQQIPPNPPTMFRISIASCNRISSAAAVLLPNDQDLCAARPAGVPPRRQGALFDPRNQNHYGPSGIEGLVKVICTFRCRLSLDAPFTSLQRATVAGSKVRQRRRYLPSDHKEQNNHCGEFLSHQAYKRTILLRHPRSQGKGILTLLRRFACQ